MRTYSVKEFLENWKMDNIFSCFHLSSFRHQLSHNADYSSNVGCYEGTMKYYPSVIFSYYFWKMKDLRWKPTFYTLNSISFCILTAALLTTPELNPIIKLVPQIVPKTEQQSTAVIPLGCLFLALSPTKASTWALLWTSVLKFSGSFDICLVSKNSLKETLQGSVN